ncbi:hypothetical protein Osc7112_3593 [Oscillatoria nigro-viridis PCC 7112]|uniref:Uncharacterized protein n=1 Tax=Phormidium nigroviride PCC 7112 TaxID=179408 RepID=K9VKC9_9CYAN|nr:hypothetical protein Osc7112_3593 [Oscillatoria nigro-viridis PCC 7112]
MSSSVLGSEDFRYKPRGIHSLADFRVSAGRFHAHENRDFDSCSAKNLYPHTDDFTGIWDMGLFTRDCP